MAFLSRSETRAMILAAIAVMAMVFTVRCAQAIDDIVCQQQPGCTIESCRAMCKSKGYANTVVDCGKTGTDTALDNCCCFNTSATELAA